MSKESALPQVEDAAAIASLAGHPGWDAMLRRVNFQKKVLEGRLKKAAKDEVLILQTGIRCWEYIEEEFRRATNSLVSRREHVATTDEMEEFKKIDAFIERVGSPQD